jgi:thiamine-phosphate pyrophosphorylase
VDIGRRLLAGGARLIQIRDKEASARVLVDEVGALASDAPEDASIVVNDRADVALVANADGVHVGQADLPSGGARALLGPNAIIGTSVHNTEQARAALDLPIDYLAVGPVFRTTTKANPDPELGLAGLEAICQISTLPVVAIGGIRLEDVAPVFRAGAASVAVIRDLIGQGDIERRTRLYLDVVGSRSVS